MGSFFIADLIFRKPFFKRIEQNMYRNVVANYMNYGKRGVVMYRNIYKQKVITASQAANLVKTGDTIMYATFLGRPVDFDNELAARADELTDVQVYCCGDMPWPIMESPTAGPEHFTCNNWFFGVQDRKLHDQGKMFYCPIQFSQLQDVIANYIDKLDYYVQVEYRRC